MRTTLLLTLLFAPLSLSFTAHAVSDGVVINPRGTSVGQRLLGYKDYEDIRIDSDLDGKVDEWYLRKGKTQVRVSYRSSKIDSVAISQIHNKIINYKRFENVSGKLRLTIAQERPVLTMYGSPENCAPQLLSAKITDFNSDISAIIKNPAVDNTSKSCNIQDLPQFSKNFSEALQLLPINGETIAGCLEKATTIKSFDVGAVVSKLRIRYDKISSNHGEEMFACQKKPNSKFHGETSEDGSINFILPEAPTDPVTSFDELEKLIHHELLHSAGVKNEKMVDRIIESCRKKGEFVPLQNESVTYVEQNSLTVVDNVANKSKANTKEGSRIAKEVSRTSPKRAPTGVDSAAAKSGGGLDMKSEIANAEAIIPSAEKLNVAKVDKSPAGKEQALRDSVQESAPVFRMANQAMGMSNNPAMADSGSSETGSSSSSSSSSSERYQSRYGRYQSKFDSGAVGNDEYVAEEIDLTKNAAAKAQKDATKVRNQQVTRSGTYQPATLATEDDGSKANSRGPASVDAETAAGRKRTGAVANNSDSGGSIATGAAGGSADLSTSSGGSGASGKTAQNRSRAPASASRGPASTAQQGSPAQKQEIMTKLTNSDYYFMKRQLKDSEFVSELEANSVKVYDANGFVWGNKSGSTIYYDDGKRFIKQR
jgi:hypothetical protein